MRKQLLSLIGALVCAGGWSTGVWAQGAAGTISGTVTDSTDAVLPGVTVVIRNTDTSRPREVITDAQGRYSAPNLAPGPYEVTASLPGFGSVVRSGIRLTVGREAVVDITLTVGQLEDQVTVVGEAPTIDTKSASTGALISQEQITGLPLNGRSFIELANLTPGVQLTDTGGRGTSTGFGVKLSVNGSRYTANLFTIDGTMLNDQFNQAGSASGNVLGVEAIREFQVLTNSFSAEFGRHTGAVINAVTKSGTNNFRGSVFEFHRNDALDAPNYFDKKNNLEQPDFQRNQFGFSVGGPLRKDRIFVFATYEGLRETLGRSQTFNVFTQALRDRAAALSSPALPYILSYPLPNGRILDANRGEYVRQDTRKTTEDYAVLRVDAQLSPSQSAFIRYTLDNSEVDNPDRVTTGQKTKTEVHFMTAEHQWIRGNAFLNRIQFGMTRSRLDGFDYVLPNITLPRTTFTDITRGIGNISVTGGIAGWGGTGTNPKFHRFRNFQVNDVVTMTRGAHSLRVGASVELLQFDLTSDFSSMGSFGFQGINNFLAGIARTFDAVMPGSDANRVLQQTVLGFFVQDDIQLRPNLTLNVGLRYEPTTDVTDTKGRLAQLIDFASPTATLNDTTVVDKVFENPSLKTFAPRAGFAWDVGGTGKMALRGGVGVFYDLVTVNTPMVQNTAVRVPPFFNRGGLVGTEGPIDFPNAYFTQRARLAGQSQLEGIQFDPDQPRMIKWNLNVQREILDRTTLEIGYTGTRGTNLFRQIFTNGREAVEVNGRLTVLPGTPLRQPNFGRMRWRVSDADSWYRGLTLSLTRRVAGLNTQVSYTWSKSEDTGAAALGSNDFDFEGAGSRYLFTEDKGLSPFDVRQSLVANVSYLLPFGKDQSGLAAALVRDWEVGTLVRLRSGYPFSVFVGFDRSQQVWSPVYPDLAPGASRNPIKGGPDQYYDPTAFVLPPDGVIGNLPRNTLIGPGLATVDLMFSRHLPIGADQRTVQLRVEIFNLLNRANFGMPSQDLFSTSGQYLADAGRITNTSTSARQVQLGVKFVW